jgi:hypothetical protein
MDRRKETVKADLLRRRDTALPRELRLGVVLVGIVFHILLVIGLIRAFTPDFIARMVDNLACRRRATALVRAGLARGQARAAAARARVEARCRGWKRS